MNKLELTNANAPIYDRVNPYYRIYLETNIWAISFRICENHIVTLESKRQNYWKYDVSDQKKILINCLFHMEQKGLMPTEVFYEVKAINKGVAGIRQLVHCHFIIAHNEMPTYYALKEQSILLNKRYGPKTYKAFDFQPLDTPDDVRNWQDYIRKDIKHSEATWTNGI